MSYVFIIDLDGTIIGDCSYQVILYNMETVIKKNKMKVSNMLLDSYKPSSKLMRPFFKYFIGAMQKQFPNSMFFVYTASDKEWANREIAMIEKTHDIKFNRPIFSRGDCIKDSFGQYRKSVKKIIPKIKKANKNCDIQNDKILVIDNNATFIDYRSNFLLCPSYNYIMFCDIWEKMKKEYMKIQEIYATISHLLATNKMCKYCDQNSDQQLDSQQLELKHKWFYKKYRKINSINKKYLNDCFWKTLANTIIDRKITSFTKNNIDILQKVVSV